MARYDDALLPKPELEPVPELPQADKDTEQEASSGDKPADDGSDTVAEPAKEDTAADALKKADEEEAKAQAAVEERRRVERENRRKQEEYDGKVEAAQKRVRELNARFADWYYVVSDAECAKIRLDRDAVIQTKPADDSK